MRWLLLSLFLLVSGCKPEVKTIGGTYDYQGVVPDMVFNLAEAIRAEYTPYANVYILTDQPLSYGIAGLANQLGPHTYIIQLHSNAPDPTATIFHEMGHIIDAERGRLDFRGHMYWDGKRCDWTIPWHERPWEISANEWRDCLIYEYQNHELKYYDYALEELVRQLKIDFIWFNRPK